MENIKKKDKREFLRHYTSTWCKGKTKTIRIPEVLADDVSNYAREIDNDNISYHEIKHIYDYIQEVKRKIQDNEKGYTRNNSGKLLNELLNL